ncbi:hypothetical protein J6590_035046 [Homalodisca vitripennis]|nr:hypothetical protein J6590_035046 [Homalodisca vitripennis]
MVRQSHNCLIGSYYLKLSRRLRLDIINNGVDIVNGLIEKRDQNNRVGDTSSAAVECLAGDEAGNASLQTGIADHELDCILTTSTAGPSACGLLHFCIIRYGKYAPVIANSNNWLQALKELT